MGSLAWALASPAAPRSSGWAAHLLNSVVLAALRVVAVDRIQRRLTVRLGEQVLGVHAGHVARVARDEVALGRRLRRRELSIRDKLAPLQRIVVGLALGQSSLADLTIGLGEVVGHAWQVASVALPQQKAGGQQPARARGSCHARSEARVCRRACELACRPVAAHRDVMRVAFGEHPWARAKEAQPEVTKTLGHMRVEVTPPKATHTARSIHALPG